MKRQTRLRPSQGGSFFRAPPVGPPPVVRDKKRCDCSNPECELPLGRCFVCQQPVENARTYCVCGDCDEAKKIRETWSSLFARKLDMAASDDRDLCQCPGWLWMNEEGDGSFNIERCDECDALVDDTEAAEQMTGACGVSVQYWP